MKRPATKALRSTLIRELVGSIYGCFVVPSRLARIMVSEKRPSAVVIEQKKEALSQLVRNECVQTQHNNPGRTAFQLQIRFFS
jgi:hypothetical protein